MHQDTFVYKEETSIFISLEFFGQLLTQCRLMSKPGKTGRLKMTQSLALRCTAQKATHKTLSALEKLLLRRKGTRSLEGFGSAVTHTSRCRLRCGLGRHQPVL